MALDHEDRAIIYGLINMPGRPARVTESEVLQYFKVDDGKKLGLDLVRDAILRRDSDDLNVSMVVCASFGYHHELLPVFLQIALQDWHRDHENVAFQLGIFGDPRAVSVLLELGRWVPGYLEWDDNRALASKAIHALARIPGEESEEALRALLDSDDDVVRRHAERQLEKHKRRWKDSDVSSSSNPRCLDLDRYHG
ncbi:HEAT repeat domain-containing protein [Nocardia cyriacigeorgica]|uniref:HEAT repeat domain-containing protein n=1 Tax=Nocardia cyriacigeorgica TaxID=135487 RepID=A0A5R8NFQ6_9NOCA|nr:HEAT repeat domain-containing protein [Nocardia cyriacigeorgica]TLF74499.1 HEAT repeat domain-containing protein [Nocardia cyriacigeorgica]